MLWYPLNYVFHAFCDQVGSTAWPLSSLGIEKVQKTFRVSSCIIQWEVLGKYLHYPWNNWTIQCLFKKYLAFYTLIRKFFILPWHPFYPFLSEHCKGVIYSFLNLFFTFPPSLQSSVETEEKSIFEKDRSHYAFSLVSCFMQLR